MQKYDAIENGILTGDVESLREAVGSICYTCRSFRNGEFDEAVEYVLSRGIPLLEDKLVGELVSKDKESFTDEDFAKAVFELKQNFTKERIEDVKAIGSALYSDGEEEAEAEDVTAADGEAQDKDGAVSDDEYKSKYENGKSNPIKRLLRSIADIFAEKPEKEESGEAPTPIGASLFDLISARGEKEKPEDGAAIGEEYFTGYKVSEDEMRRECKNEEKVDTDTPDGENSASGEEKSDNARGFDISKIDPLYIAAGAVGLLTIALIIIAFLQ